jgi:hypothetical protein
MNTESFVAYRVECLLADGSTKWFTVTGPIVRNPETGALEAPIVQDGDGAAGMLALPTDG